MMKIVGVETLCLNVIHPSETNPRKNFAREPLVELRESMRESGLIEPITVRPKDFGYEVVAGERRFRCARELGWESIDCVVRDLSDAEMATIQMAENVARNQLNPIEEADGVQRMVMLGMDAAEVSKRLGMGRRWVQGRLALGELPMAARKAVEAEVLSIKAANVILKVEEEEREGAVQELLAFGDELSVAQVEDLLEERYFRPRDNRRRWSVWCQSVKSQWEGVAGFVEDPEAWAEYVHPYGKPVGRWKVATERIGSAAARSCDAGMTWGHLAKALGMEGLLVPVGGVVDDGFGNVILLVDGTQILAAEKASKKAGHPYTIGKRVTDEATAKDTKETKEEGDVEGCGVADGPGSDDGFRDGRDVDEWREARWSPWAVRGVLVSSDEAAKAGMLVMLVMNQIEQRWKLDAAEYLEIPMDDLEDLVDEEFETWLPLAVWWLLEGERERVQLVALAEELGVLEIWREGGAE